MHPISCTNTHHDVTDLVNHGLIKNMKTRIPWVQNITFLRNKNNFKLYLRWHISRSYRFVAEVTFKSVADLINSSVKVINNGAFQWGMSFNPECLGQVFGLFFILSASLVLNWRLSQRSVLLMLDFLLIPLQQYINDLPDDVIYNTALSTHVITVYCKIDRSSYLGQQFEWVLNLNLTFETLDWGRK